MTLPRSLAANPRLSGWVRLAPDGCFEIRVGKVELGQGILTALAQIAADELDVPLDRVRMVPAGTAEGPDEGITAGSLSVADSGAALRQACAEVRALRAAGATTWDRDADGSARPKSAADLRVVGTSVPRLDLPDKVAGRPRYVHDLRLPGLLYGRVVRPPSRGARLVSVGPGVDAVVDGSFLGVVAATETEADRAASTLAQAAVWDEADTLPDEDALPSFLRAGPLETSTVVAGAAVSGGFRASYSRPFLAHASIAPSCAVAQWDGERVRVWSHTQGPHPLRRAIAQALGLPPSRVEVSHVEGAGAYGHNGADDAAFDAVLLARTVPGRPVLVRWSRRDELTWAPFGSAMVADVAATVDGDGMVTAWSYDVWSQGHVSRPGYAGSPGLLAAAHLEEPHPLPPPADPPLERGAGIARNAVPVYAFPERSIRAHRALRAPLRSSSLRSLGAFLNVFAIESFMDELALAAGRDPLAHRLAHLTDPRARAVLLAAAELGGWGGDNRGIGLARYKERGAYCAVVAEVEAEQDIRVRRLAIAVDVGRVVNPDGVRNQIEGGAVQAASWTLKERVRFDRRRVTSVDWESYPILRFSEVPRVDVALLDRPDEPSVGAGEAAQGPTAAAIGNALAAALGVRVRDLPLTRERVVAAIDA
ncbi:molybdopterin cofactor-binding domain-containing protein [Phytohabitans sp. LJ34]|uniref:xanthine dehydrogenase family protein molybdopterin-binding subunit n=1 Tax=Phytohabitans sp. LJ34 TaxID=3452217 RepID=UPI003F8BA3B1